ncbi:MAG: glycosyltransferase family 2 protein [Bacteroidales bacterium]|nr:glycosyltransferase family 2 protein [Bacteroidales bacterium]
MKVLIVIVAYNFCPWIKKCLSSIDNSKYDIMVVDNCSTDATVTEIKAHYPYVILEECKQNIGFGQANNIGLHYAIDHIYDYVLLLNQDAWLMPDTVEMLIAAHQQNPDYWVLSPLQQNAENTALETHFANYCARYHVDAKSLTIQEVDFVNAAIWLLPISTIKKVGGFNPLFPHYAEDDDYTHRVLYHGGKVGIFPPAIAFHVGSSLIKQSVEQQQYRATLIFLRILSNLFYSPLVARRKCNLFCLRKTTKALLSLDKVKGRIIIGAYQNALQQMSQVKKSRIEAKQEGAFL